MRNAIVISGSDIFFNTHFAMALGSWREEYDINTFFTQHGLFIPMTKCGTEALDIIEGGTLDVGTSNYQDELGVLVTHTGVIYNYTRDSDNNSKPCKVQRRRIRWGGDKTRVVLSAQLGVVNGIAMALELTNGNFPEALKILRKIFLVSEKDWVKFHIPTLMNTLKETGRTKPVGTMSGYPCDIV